MADKFITLYHGSSRNFNKFDDKFQNHDVSTGRLYYGQGFYFTTSRVMALCYGNVIYKVKAKTTKILDLADKKPLTRTQAYNWSKQLKNFLQNKHPKQFRIMEKQAREHNANLINVIDSYKNIPDEEKMFWHIHGLLFRQPPRILQEFLKQLGYNGIRDERDETIIYNIFTHEDVNILEKQKVKVPDLFPDETLTLFGQIIDNIADDDEYRWWNDDPESKIKRRQYMKKKYIRRKKRRD